MKREISQIEIDHWQNYLDGNKNRISKLVLNFSPKILCDMFFRDIKHTDDAYLYILLRLHLSQQVSIAYFEDVYNMDERKALLRSLNIGRVMMETFADEFWGVFNEWGVQHNLKSKFR